MDYGTEQKNKYAEYLYENAKKKDFIRGFKRDIGEQYYIFDIKTICNFDVDARLEITKKNICLAINSNEILDKDGFQFSCFIYPFNDKIPAEIRNMPNKERELFVKNFHTKLIIKSIDILNKGFEENSFDEFFLSLKEEEKRFKHNFGSIFTHESIKQTFSSCCVCNETTTHQTVCNHSVCVPCLIRMKRTNNKKCPLCRKDEICYLNKSQ